MSRMILVALAAALASLPSPARSWNDLGHMTVAATAWSRMTNQAKARASALLRLNPQYPRWVAGVAPADRDAVAFLRASTWPDYIKALECPKPPEAQPAGCYADTGYRPADAGDRLNIGYADLDLRLYWHFKNVGFSSDGTTVLPPFRYNAESQIDLFIVSIADPELSADARSFDLTWLLHLAGDVHQPLHAVARFSGDDRDGDSGGNGVKLCPEDRPRYCSKNEQRTLHSYWDGALGRSSKPDAAFAKAATYSSYTPSAAELGATPRQWIDESVAAAKRWVYVGPIGAGSGSYVIRSDSAYARNAGSIAEQRVRLAGARLAAILNRTLI